MNRHSRSTRALVEAALMIALATILGYFRLYRFPQGGSVDFAMVPHPDLLPALGPGLEPELLLCQRCAPVLPGRRGIALSWQSMLLDYVVAYTLVFLCGAREKAGAGCGEGTILAGGWDGGYLTLSGGLLWYMYMPEEFWDCPWWTPGSTP